MPADGASIICFWAEPAKQKTNQNDPDEGADDKYTSPGSNTDGGGCNAEPVDEPENNDISDAVYLDTGAPRAEGLDVQPENITVAGASRFSLRSVVYDQFGSPSRATPPCRPSSSPARPWPPTATTTSARSIPP